MGDCRFRSGREQGRFRGITKGAKGSIKGALGSTGAQKERRRSGSSESLTWLHFTGLQLHLLFIWQYRLVQPACYLNSDNRSLDLFYVNGMRFDEGLPPSITEHRAIRIQFTGGDKIPFSQLPSRSKLASDHLVVLSFFVKSGKQTPNANNVTL